MGRNDNDEEGRHPAVAAGRSRFSPQEACRNCGDPTPGNYCPQCGQAKRDVAVSVGAMVADVLEDQFVLNRALPRTLRALFLRPGHLTNEYLQGRRVRYIAPFRLYLASSVVFFLLFSTFGLRGLDPYAGALDANVNRALAAAEESGMSPPGDSAGERSGAPTREIQPWARNLTINLGSEETNRRVRQRTQDRFGHLPVAQAVRAFMLEYLRYAPQMVFLLLPVFALILKLLYVRSGRYYAEHFVFSLHFHAFAFGAAILGIPMGWGMALPVIGAVVVAYLWMGLRVVYGQGVFWTTTKGLLLGGAYTMVLLVAFLISVSVTFLLL